MVIRVKWSYLLPQGVFYIFKDFVHDDPFQTCSPPTMLHILLVIVVIVIIIIAM